MLRLTSGASREKQSRLQLESKSLQASSTSPMYLYTPASPCSGAPVSMSMKGGDLPVPEHLLYHISSQLQAGSDAQEVCAFLAPTLICCYLQWAQRQQQQPLRAAPETVIKHPSLTEIEGRVLGGACLLPQAISSTRLEAALTHFSSS